jgi:chorismate mutase/prephenate dehydratase
MAADRLFPHGTLVYFKSFDAVCAAVESGLCQFGVLPIENSTNGSVRAVYTLLRERRVGIVRATKLFIRHELLARPGVSFDDITEIYSHEQALGQCSEFLKTLGDRVKIIPCENTAVAARRVAESGSGTAAAIASHDCGALYGLKSLRDDIQNSDHNYTRFICIAKNPDLYPGANRVSLILALRHRPGALYETLAELAARGINLLKLESYPVSGHDFAFQFFLDMEASVLEAPTAALLRELERGSEGFKYLGNYLEV